MIYWFTGNPGHGKTLHAIDKALDFLAKGRAVYVCNVNGFDYKATGAHEMTPEQFRDWWDFLPDGAVCLVDEVYQHGMLPKRPPSSAVPKHVEKLAVHRHRGIDFIFVSQSPRTQCDNFVYDLVEEHVHVRRRFGTKFVTLKVFDHLEANPVRALPLVRKQVRLPSRPMGLYKSTELDTSERRMPWYVWIAAPALIAVPVTMWYAYHALTDVPDGVKGITAAAPPAGNGATATVTAGGSAAAAPLDYMAQVTPSVHGVPWSAPIFEDVAMSNRPPDLHCMSSGVDGVDSCTCVTEQGTVYRVHFNLCRHYARYGVYNPYRQYSDTGAPVSHSGADSASLAAPSGSRPLSSGAFGDQVARYGAIRPGLSSVAPYVVDGEGEFPTRDRF